MSKLSVLKPNVESIRLMIGETSNINVVIYPNFLIDDTLIFKSSDESVTKVRQVGSSCIVYAVGSGYSTINISSKEDPKVSVSIPVSVYGQNVLPEIENIDYREDGSFTVTLKPNNAKRILVDKSWTKEAVDLDTESSIFTLKLPEYVGDFYIRIAFSDGVSVSRWITQKLETNNKKEYFFYPNGFRNGGSNYYSVTFVMSQVEKIEISYSWTDEEIDQIVDLSNLDESNNKDADDFEYYSDDKQIIVYIPNPGIKETVSASFRAKYRNGKNSGWYNYELLWRKRDDYNAYPILAMPYAFIYNEVLPDANPQHQYYDGPNFEGEAVTFTPGEIFFEDLNYNEGEYYGKLSDYGPGIRTVYVEDEDGYYSDWAVIQVNGSRKYFKLLDLAFYYYSFITLALRNCQGSSVSEKPYTFGSKFVRGNFAVLYTSLLDYPALCGYKLLRNVSLYNVDGTFNRELKKGTWVWFGGHEIGLNSTRNGFMTSSQVANDLGFDDFFISYESPENLTAYHKRIVAAGSMREGNPSRIAITSFSENVDLEEVEANIIKLDTIDENYSRYFGIYYAELLGEKGQAVDTTLLPDIPPDSFGDEILGGEFDYDEQGDLVLEWTGSEYSVRDKIIHTTTLDKNNDTVIGKLHQGYLVKTSTRGDITQAYSGNACVVSSTNKHIFDEMIMPLTKKFVDRHSIQEFYHIGGFFDQQKEMYGHIIGKKRVCLCTKDLRHISNQTHVEDKLSEYVLNPEDLDKGEKLVSEDNSLEARENLTSLESNVLGCLIPFVQYIDVRLRKKCVEATGKPINLLDTLFTSYNSNFAIYNDPVNGYLLNGTRHYTPLYGVKVLKELDCYRYYRDNYGDYPELTIPSYFMPNGDLITLTLQEGDWVWFSMEYPPRFSTYYGEYISIMGVSFGTDLNGDPTGQIVNGGLYIDPGLNLPKPTSESETLEGKIKNKINTIFGAVTGTEVIPEYSSKRYRIATMANIEGNDPIYLDEDSVYDRKINNSLCFNYGDEIRVTDEYGFPDVIPSGRLFTFLSEYTSLSTKYSRVFYYSDQFGAYRYGSIMASGASIFEYYDIRRFTTADENIDHKTYGILPIFAETDIYSRHGEYFTTAHEKDMILFDKKINENREFNSLKVSEIPGYILNKDDYDDLDKSFSEINEFTTCPVRPNWVACEYFAYNGASGKEEDIIIKRIKGYAKLDFSINYSEAFK